MINKTNQVPADTQHHASTTHSDARKRLTDRLRLKKIGLLEDGLGLRAGRLYYMVLLFLVVAIVVVGIKTVEQVSLRHKTYRELTEQRAIYRALKTEEERLIIEQQTFSAIGRVASRSVNELGMFYPTEKERLLIVKP